MSSSEMSTVDTTCSVDTSTVDLDTVYNLLTTSTTVDTKDVEADGATSDISHVELSKSQRHKHNDKQPLLSHEGEGANKANRTLWDAPIIAGFVSFKSILGKDFGRALYVLFVLTLTWMLAQMATFMLGVTAESMQREQNWGPGDGLGREYDFLAGPVFAVMSMAGTLPVGFVVDKRWISREWFLGIACIVWSVATVLTGASTHYFQLVIYRMVLAIATSAAQPLGASIVSDFYPPAIRASAMAIFNFGIYIGFSAAYGVCLHTLILHTDSVICVQCHRRGKFDDCALFVALWMVQLWWTRNRHGRARRWPSATSQCGCSESRSVETVRGDTD